MRFLNYHNWLIAGTMVLCAAVFLETGQSRLYAAGSASPELELEQALDKVHATYLIMPDKRFVRAAEFIVQRLGENPTSATLSLEPAAGKWNVSIEGKPLGQIGQMDNFSQNMKFVEGVAKAYVKDRNGKADSELIKTLEAEVSESLVKDLWKVGKKIDQIWRDETVPLPLHAATKASLYLQLQTLDLVGLGDEISARAIAFMATESALSGAPLVREKALLAQLICYKSDAFLLAKDLAENDPVRCYIYNKASELYATAARSDATVATWYLAARLAVYNQEAYNEDPDELLGIIKLRPNLTPRSNILSLAPLAPFLAKWDGGAQYALQMASALAAEIDGRELSSGNPFKSGETLVPVFAHGLEQLPDDSAGPLIDRQLMVACYETAFCSAYEFCENFFINRYGSVKDARDLGEAFGTVQHGGVGEYSRLMEARLTETGEGESSVRLQQLLDSLKYVSGDQSARIYNKINANYEALMPKSVKAGLSQLKRLDGRPENYSLLECMFTVGSLRDLSVAEQIYVAKASPENQITIVQQAFLHLFRGERDELMQTLEDSHIPDHTRANYIDTFMAKDPEFTTATLDKKFEEIYHRSPTNRSVVNNYISYLKKQNRLDEAITIAAKFAKSQATKTDLSFPYARCALAELYEAKGDMKQALEVSESVAESYTATALNNMSEYNTALGDYEAGLEWAKKSMERYERSAGGLAVLVYCYWAQGKYEEAATAIKDFKSPIDSYTLRHTFGDYFLKALGDKTPAERDKALAEMEKADMGSDLADMGYVFRAKNRYDLVFEFTQRVKESGYQKYRTKVICYNALQHDKGTSAALAWLLGQVPEANRAELGPLAFRESEYELLDSVVPYDDSTTLGQYNWTLRAAAVCADKASAQLMGERVRQHFSSGNSPDFHFVAGRFLLGLADKAALDNAAKSPEEICQGACYLAYKARADGNYREASDWLQVTLLSGIEELNEYHKARLILAGWGAVNRSLSIMEDYLEASPQSVVPGM